MAKEMTPKGRAYEDEDFAKELHRLLTHYDVVGRERSPASNEIGMGLESTP